MTVSSSLIRPNDPRWAAFLLRTEHDFYHLPEYAVLSAREEGGEAVAFYAECGNDALLIPLLLRPITPESSPIPLQDAASPYGYASPLATPGMESAVLARFLHAFSTVASSQRIVSAFLRLHPLLSLDADVLRSAGSVVDHGETVTVDTAKSADEIEAGIRRGYRYDIRKLRAAGMVCEFDNWGVFSDFIAVYRATMQRVGAGAAYFFSDRYFQDLREMLGDSLHLACVRAADGAIAAAALVTHHGAVSQYHLSGTHESFVGVAPTKLLLRDAISWAAARGARVFHLGGGVGGRSDSLFNFKAGFSDDRRIFRTFRMVLDRNAYEGLVGEWNRQNPTSTDSNFFPLYRAAG